MRSEDMKFHYPRSLMTEERRGEVKRTALTTFIVVVLLIATAAVVWADKPVAFDSQGNETGWEEAAGTEKCARIQDGTLLRSDGEPIVLGYDEWGYNYQAHMFNGMYCDAYRDAQWCQPYKDISLLMKWNDAWLANTDCDDDGLLDRHYGSASYIGSGAWETNHQSGEYEQDGKICKWSYFVKIIAVPADAALSGDTWYNADGVEIGPEIWGAFAIIQEVYNDPCGGEHGISYLSPDHPGFGGW
jgi:hypothetical protein